jgi:hypothetical protein
MAKDPKTGQLVPWRMSALDESRWMDGSLENDLPMRRLAELFNVNHFIVAQVNPHVYPFLRTDLRQTWLSVFLEKLLILAGSEARFRLAQLSRFGLFSQTCHRLLSVMSQPYVGDITIVPKLTVKDVVNILAPSTPQSVKEAIDKGERAAWPYLSMIHNRCAVELALEDIIYSLRCRLVEEGCALKGIDGKEILTSPSTRSLTLDLETTRESDSQDHSLSDNSTIDGTALLVAESSNSAQPNNTKTTLTSGSSRKRRNRKGKRQIY